MAAAGYGGTVTIQEPSTSGGVSVEVADEPAATVHDMTSPAPSTTGPGGLGVGLMVLITFTVTILAALGDTAINGSITAITGAVFVVVCVLAAATVGYRDLSTAIITPPLAYFTAILLAGQPELLQGDRDNLLLREVAMVVAGLAFNAPWIFAGTGAAALIVIVRRWILHR